MRKATRVRLEALERQVEALEWEMFGKQPLGPWYGVREELKQHDTRLKDIYRAISDYMKAIMEYLEVEWHEEPPTDRKVLLRPKKGE